MGSVQNLEWNIFSTFIFYSRWEVPDVVVSEKTVADDTGYIFSWTENPFGFAVQRSDNRTAYSLL
jgi:hypothetical protein